MKPTLTVACISLKSAWQVSLRSALTALLLAPLAAFAQDEEPRNLKKPGSLIVSFADLFIDYTQGLSSFGQNGDGDSDETAIIQETTGCGRCSRQRSA